MQSVKNNGIKYLSAYLFFLSVTTVRFFGESHFANFNDKTNLIFHHHYWFLFVFILFLINFKYFLKLQPSKTWWLAFCSPVILIPLIYNMVFRGGNIVKFNYLSARDLPNYLKDIGTFMIFSEKNRPIAIELIMITLAISIFGYYVTRKPVRSILCAVSCYLSLMILAGTVIIAPQKPDFTLFVPESSMKLQNFMSFVYFFASVVAITVLFFREIVDFIKERKRFILLIVLFTVFFTGFQFLLTSPSTADRVLMIPHSFLFAFFITMIVFLKKNAVLKVLVFIQIVISSGILYLCFRVTDRPVVDQKIKSALSYLEKKQERNGDFASESCRSVQRKECTKHTGSVFIPTFISYSLKFVKNNSVADSIYDKGIDFIRSKRGSGDLWRFWGTKIDPDLDDTACASFLLESEGEKLLNKEKIYNNRNNEGHFNTWIRSDRKNDVDAVVNTNVLLYLGENPKTAASCNLVVNSILDSNESRVLYYYPDSNTLFYTLSRAHFEKKLSCIEKAVPFITMKVKDRLKNSINEKNAMQTAMLLNTLLNFNQRSEITYDAVEMLHKTQRRDGSWEGSVFFIAGEPPDPASFYYFSDETATALVIEFLSRYTRSY